MKPTYEFPEHAEENRRIWDANARWWDDEIGDGNEFQDVLIEPTTVHLLEAQRDDRILDIACGAGRLARRLARLGANVVGFDYSAAFIERARQRGEAEGVEIEYHVLDAGDERALLSLGTGRFDRSVCSMALMDMPCIDPLMSALGTLLKPGGCFVFSIAHPCFHSAAVQRYQELAEEPSGRHASRKGVKVWGYLTAQARKTEGIIGQPESQYIFHRPLHAIFSAGFRAGFVVDGLEEPAFPADAVVPEGLRWIDMTELPPVIVVRMRLGAAE
jgi:SAM-dependent methyltransferase